MQLNNQNNGSDAELNGNSKVLWIAFAAFSLGFGIWGMFSALGPFLIKWYNYTPSQVLFLGAMPPLFATITSIPLGILSDKYGGRKVFTLLLFALTLVLIAAMFVSNYFMFLIIGMLLGLGGASFVVGNTHVSVWYPKSKQGTALGIFALGNVGIALGTVFVPLLIENVCGGPVGYDENPVKFSLGPIEGWRTVFFLYAIPAFIMGIIYWTMTSEPPNRKSKLSMAEIIGVYKSGVLVWIIAFLYWVSFGTITYFSSCMPTYLSDQWGVDKVQASMIYTSCIVICVGSMRPLGGFLSDRFNPLKVLSLFFVITMLLALVLVAEISFPVQITAVYCMALASGVSASCVMKLIPSYFPQAVGTVSGLAKAAGAACGFTMSTLMALSKNMSGGYKYAFAAWAAMNVLALVFVLSPKYFGKKKTPQPDLLLKETIEDVGSGLEKPLVLR